MNGASLPGWKGFAGSFDRRRGNTIEIAAWVEKPASGQASIEVTTARIEYQPVEAGS